MGDKNIAAADTGTGKLAYTLEKLRLQIARRVRDLRLQRAWTQQDLAKRLGLSQGRLSELERGTGSLTAEQFLTLLSLFNVPLGYFAKESPKQELDLQNALARFGAAHLHESEEVVPSERLEELPNVIRETLVSQSPRQIAALAPVLVANADHINLRKLYLDLSDVGLDRRLAWVVENTIEGVRAQLPTLPPGPSGTATYRRAELLLGTFHDFLADQQSRSPQPVPLDVVESRHRRDEADAGGGPRLVLRDLPAVGIVTGLQAQDFVDALRGARAGR